MQTISLIRVFTIAAMIVSGVLQLYAVGVFSVPLVQLATGAVAGMAAVTAVRLLHIL